jgi:hypothetical protein
VKLVPFHNSVNVRVEPLVSVTEPIATQSVGVTHDTPDHMLVPTFGPPVCPQVVEPCNCPANV